MFQQLLPEPVELDDAGVRDAYALPAGEPVVRAGFVSSLDGAASLGGSAGGLGGPADQRILRLLREQSDAVLVGAGTIRAEGYGGPLIDDEAQARRRGRGDDAHPQLVIVSGRLDLEPDAPVFADAPARPIVLTSRHAPADAVAALGGIADVVRVGQEHTDLAAGLAELRKRGLARVVCEGGPSLLGALAQADLVDELCLTTSGILAGGEASRIATGADERTRRYALAHLLLAEGMLFARWRSAG